MRAADYRARMSVTAFEAIPVDPDDPIDGYYEALIDRNEQIDYHVFESTEQFQQLTRGQRLLIQIGTFDSQVKNGGLTQFFWNQPESIFDVADGIESLGAAELLGLYERALEGLVGKKDEWLALRAEWARGKDSPRWETFQKSYELLDLGWFDEAYFDQWGYNEGKDWVRLGRGLHHSLLTQLGWYVQTHRDEFIAQ